MTAVGEENDGVAGGAKALQAHIAVSFSRPNGEFTLARDGLKPIVFSGSLLAEVSGWRPGARLWYELAVYSRDEGGFVAAMNVFKKDIDARDRRWARTFKTREEVSSYFETHDSSNDVERPQGSTARRISEAEGSLQAAALRQQMTEARTDYEAAAGELLDALYAD
jgi:hypothetical protein